ncbi:class I SAM-dependent methyltransferase [Yimella sp. cx-573]|nr:class I SAM-dependent methyltransferase [Yimella sp. cx-573]
MATYTHGHAASVLRSHSSRTVDNSAAYLAPHLDPSARLLDIGAGPGTITLDFAVRVEQVTASEITEDVLALARGLAAERGATNVDFAVEDVHQLSFADASFDITHAHQVLQHVADPVAALREMRRVTRPGGIVAARDADYSAFAWWPQVPELDEWMQLYQDAARANQGEPDAGRRLLSWARAAGFKEVTVSASVWCYATPEERQWWGGMWADRIVDSALTRQLLEQGRANEKQLRRVSDAWRRWAAADDGWFVVPHGEVLCRV